MPYLSTAPSFAIVALGEANLGATQTGFTFQMGALLREAGLGDQPFAMTIGSSSGSLIATAASAGVVDHAVAKQAWIDFGQATRFFRRGRSEINPYPAALQGVLNSGLLDFERAFNSDTHVIVTAAKVDQEHLRHFRSEGFSLLQHGLKLLLRGPEEPWIDYLTEGAHLLNHHGRRVFEPRYLMNQPHAGFESQEGATVVGSAKELRKAVEASSRIPGLYGPPIEWGADLLIDGVFANNAPVEFALRAGIDHVFVLTSSNGGNVFERPIQSLASRYVREALRQTGALSQKGRARHLGRLRESLAEIGKLEGQLSKPQALDLEALRAHYPDQHIHVVHPKQEIPISPLFRFFGSDPQILSSLYETGRKAADALWESEGGFGPISSGRVKLGSGRPGAPGAKPAQTGT